MYEVCVQGMNSIDNGSWWRADCRRSHAPSSGWPNRMQGMPPSSSLQADTRDSSAAAPEWAGDAAQRRKADGWESVEVLDGSGWDILT